MPDPRSASDLAEIVEAIARIRVYVADLDEAGFAANMMAYDAVLMNLLVIGEAVRRLDPAILETEPSIPWTKVVGLRNRIAHGYEDIDPAPIWKIATADLPGLASAAQRLLMHHRA